MTTEATTKRVLNIGKLDPDAIKAMYQTAQQRAEQISRSTEQGKQYTDLITQLLNAVEKEEESFRTVVQLARLTVPDLAEDDKFEGSLSSWLNTNEAKKHFEVFNASINNPNAEGKYKWVRIKA
jgi:hypothetical protein